MNFKNLSKEKRNQLLLVFILTLAVAGGLGFGLVKGQYQDLASLASRKSSIDQKLQQMKDAIKHGERLDSDLAEAKKELSEQESDLASGDLYSWVITTMRQFKADYKIDIPQFSPISQPTDVTLLPKFPYKQAVLSVSGTARFHDFGRFLADFENRFPHIRVLNLSLEAIPPTSAPGTPVNPEEQEMLSFKIDVVTLVKPNAS